MDYYRPVLQVAKFSVLLIQLDIDAIGLKTSSYEVRSQVSPGWRTILLASLSVGCGIYTTSKTNHCLNFLQLPYWKLCRWWYRVAYDYYRCHAHLHISEIDSRLCGRSHNGKSSKAKICNLKSLVTMCIVTLRLLSEFLPQVVQMCEVKDDWMLPARVGMMLTLGIFKQITRFATCKREC